MNRLDYWPAKIFRRFVCTAILSSVFAIQIGWSGEASETASPFPRLTDPSGCMIEQITNDEYEQHQVHGASWDGKKLLISGNKPGPGENETTHPAFEVNLVTGERKDLSHILENSGPYSPDGRFSVVAQNAENGKTDIFEYEHATGKLAPISSHDQWDWLPSYSHDGQFIVFNSYRVDGQADIHLYEKATGKLQRLTDYPGYDAHATFSSDGKRILFNRQRGERETGGYIFDVIVYDLKTGTEKRLTDADFEEGYPSWAPDDQHIVFSTDQYGEPGKHNLFVLSPDGSTTRLTSGDWKDWYSYWTPDGKYIYFNSTRAGNNNVFRMRMDGLDCVRGQSEKAT